MTNRYVANAVKNSYFVLAFSVISIIIGYALRIFLSRSLSIEDFGLFYAISSFLGIFILLRYLGLNQALVKYIPEFLVKKDKRSIKSSLATMLILQTVSIFAFLAVLFVFEEPISALLFRSPQAGTVMLILAMSFLPSMLFVAFQSVFHGYQKLRTYALVEPVRIASIFVLSLFFIRMGAIGIAIATLMASIITVAVFFLEFYKLGLLREKTIISLDLAGKLLRFGTPVLISSAAVIIINYTDTLAITFFRTLEEVALYQTALPTSQLLLFFSGSIATVIFPMFSGLYARGNKKGINNGLGVALVLMLLLMLPLVAALAAFPETVIRILFGTNFLQAAPALRILSISVVFYSVFFIFQTTLEGIGKPFSATKAIFCIAAVNFVLNVLLVPAYGITGAAVASLAAYIVGVPAGFFLVRKYLNTQLPLRKISKIGAAAIASFLCMTAAGAILNLPEYYEFVLAVVFGWIIYILATTFSGSITIDDVRFIESGDIKMPAALKKFARMLLRK